MQKLIMPIHVPHVTAGFKNTNYRNKFGFEHYGVDMIDMANPRTRQVYGMGYGLVLDRGCDSVFGNYLTIFYPRCYSSHYRSKFDLVVNMFHFSSTRNLKTVSYNALLGVYGNTGSGSKGAHLHIEIRRIEPSSLYLTNRVSAFSTPSFSKSTLFFENPMHFLHLDEEQRLGYDPKYYDDVRVEKYV